MRHPEALILDNVQSREKGGNSEVATMVILKNNILSNIVHEYLGEKNPSNIVSEHLNNNPHS